MNLTPTPGFAAPVLKRTSESAIKDGVLIRASLISIVGIYFTTPAYAGLERGDRVRMCSVPVGGQDQPVYGPWVEMAALIDHPSLLKLAVRQITLVGLSLEATIIDVHYYVEKADGSMLLSSAFRIYVTKPYENDDGTGRFLLARPEVLNQRNADGTLPLGESVLKIRVPRPPQGWDRNMFLNLLGTDSRVTNLRLASVTWTNAASSPATAPQKGKDYLPVDAADITVDLGETQGFNVMASQGRILRLWYTALNGTKIEVSGQTVVSVEGVAAPLPSLSIGDDAQLAVDSYSVAVGVAPVDASPGAFIFQPASGGREPYVYSSSNGYVASVDPEGVVTATGNGMATISVTDATGNEASFRLKVIGCNVLMCVRNEPYVGTDGKQSLEAALTAMHGRQYGGSLAGVIPSIGDLRAIWSQYHDSRPGLAGRLRWNQDSDTEAWYWTRDTTRDDGTPETGAYRVNLNAVSEDLLINIVPYAELARTRCFVAMVEGNHWLGFETFGDRYSWYQDGTYARAAGQPWRAASEKDDRHEKEVGGDI